MMSMPLTEQDSVTIFFCNGELMPVDLKSVNLSRWMGMMVRRGFVRLQTLHKTSDVACPLVCRCTILLLENRF